MSLSIFSRTKRLLHARESISLQSLIAQRVAQEAIGLNGGANNVKITPGLVASHKLAHQRNCERLAKQKRESEQRDRDQMAENDARRKRKAEEAERVDFETKKKALDEEEKSLSKELQFDDVRLTGLVDTAINTKNPTESKSAMTAAKLLRGGMKTKQERLDKIRADKLKLVGSRRNKTSK